MSLASAVLVPLSVSADAPDPSVCAGGAAAGVHVDWITEVPARLREEWEALAQAASEPNCFAEAWFADASLRNFADRSICLAEVRGDDGLLLGLASLHIVSHYARLRVPHVQNWRHHNHFLGTPLVRAGHETAFWSALLTCLDAATWARGFLHFDGLVAGGPVHRGLDAAARELGRSCAVVHAAERAELASRLSPADYYERTVRKKKRKELKRLSNRLAELGRVSSRVFGVTDRLDAWCDEFLALELAGWKGRAGSALGCAPATEAFFRSAIAGAHASGRLEFRRLDLDGRAIAMLVNFLSPPGSFSFKIAFDESYARFSPGVLIQIDNLEMLARGDIAWMDSCAAENHAMIESLWGERRRIVRVTVRLAGLRRSFAYYLCRSLEKAAARSRSAAARLRDPDVKESL